MGTQLAAYRDEIARLFVEIDKRDAIILELRNKIARLEAECAEKTALVEMNPCASQSGGCAYAAETARLLDEIDRLRKNLKGQNGRLKRYENSTTPGRHGYNEEREHVRAEEERMHAAETGFPVKEKRAVGAPPGHAGHKCEIKPARTEEHEYEKCPRCGCKHLKRRGACSKIIADFADGRTLVVTLHTGHAVRCNKCRRTFMPKFPGIKGTCFGITVLGYILEYAGKKNTDGDIAYYMEKLYGYTCSTNSIWNARRAIADALEPSVRAIIEELKKAPYLMIDETVYRYKKKKIYVWVVRTDTVTFVLPSVGRGEIHAPEFLRELSHIPVVTDGYSVYTRMFLVRQRCWAHVLLKAEEAYIRCRDPALKKVRMELYHRLRDVYRKAKAVAEATGNEGGADAATCLQLEREVAQIVAAYGNDDFATHLGNAMPNLFTFLKYPGLPPTNNATERDIRDAVVSQRRFRHKFATLEGMRVFSTIHSFVNTCKKMRVAPGQMLVRLTTQPGFDVISYGLSASNPEAPPRHGVGVESGTGRSGAPAEPDADAVQCSNAADAGGVPNEDKPSEDAAEAAPPPTARPIQTFDGAAAAACVILACLQAGGVIWPDIYPPARNLSHLMRHETDVGTDLMAPAGTSTAHLRYKPPPAYIA